MKILSRIAAVFLCLVCSSVCAAPAVISSTYVYADDGSTPTENPLSVSVPSDAVAVVIMWHCVADSAEDTGVGLTSISSNFTGTLSVVSQRLTLAGTNQTCGGIAVGAVTSTGAGKSVTIAWTESLFAGVAPVSVTFLSGVTTPSDISSWVRDYDSVAGNDAAPLSFSIDTQPSDLVVQMAAKFDGTVSLQSGWTSILEVSDVGTLDFRVSRANSPGASSTTVTFPNPYFSSLNAVSLKDTPIVPLNGSMFLVF